jgi:hypothetical protein
MLWIAGIVAILLIVSAIQPQPDTNKPQPTLKKFDAALIANGVE